MADKQKYALFPAVCVQDEEQDLLVFQNMDEVVDYYNLTPGQYAKWVNEYESPWGGNECILPAYQVVSTQKTRVRRTGKKTEDVEVMRFRVSYDGDHWDRIEQFFTSLTSLITYVAFYLHNNSPIPSEDVDEVLERLKKDYYAKWVSPNDKKRKYYIQIERLLTNPDYLD